MTRSKLEGNQQETRKFNNEHFMNNGPIKIPSIQSGMHLNPGEKVPQTLLDLLQKVNQRATASKSFPDYEKDIRQLFQLSPPQITERTADYLAGFVEGEGSLSAGAKKNTTSRFKVYIDPEFSATQHLNGISNLVLLMSSFKTGRIRHKTGSNATFVYSINNRKTLAEKVVPFYERYLSKFGPEVKKRRVLIFKMLLQRFDAKAHLELDKMLNEILPLWHAMRMQVGQKNETFKSLQEAQDYIRKAVQNESQAQTDETVS